MELYQTIFKRKSVRKFNDEQLSQQKKAMIMQRSETLKALDPTIKTKIVLVSAAQINKLMAVKAPNYLLIYSEKKAGHLLNAGFIMQQMDLYLSAQGIGSCWLGMASPKNKKIDNMSFVATLAVGEPAEAVHRRQLSEFKRKALDEIADCEEPLLEAVRLAPSATNKQPWYITCEQDALNIYRQTPQGLSKIVFEKLTQLDLGIALCHLSLAMQEKNYPFSLDTAAPLPALNNYTSVGKVALRR